MYSDADDRKREIWRRAQADMRRLAQQYDMQASRTADQEQAAELRELAAATRRSADELKP